MMPPYPRLLGWLAALATVAGNGAAARAYFEQLVSWCFFSDRTVDLTDD
jgi:hypothetical protein